MALFLETRYCPIVLPPLTIKTSCSITGAHRIFFLPAHHPPTAPLQYSRASDDSSYHPPPQGMSRSIKVVPVGDKCGSAGTHSAKTSLLQSFVTLEAPKGDRPFYRVAPEYMPRVFDNYESKYTTEDGENVTLSLWDTAGQVCRACAEGVDTGRWRLADHSPGKFCICLPHRPSSSTLPLPHPHSERRNLNGAAFCLIRGPTSFFLFSTSTRPRRWRRSPRCGCRKCNTMSQTQCAFWLARTSPPAIRHSRTALTPHPMW